MMLSRWIGDVEAFLVSLPTPLPPAQAQSGQASGRACGRSATAQCASAAILTKTTLSEGSVSQSVIPITSPHLTSPIVFICE